MQLAYEVRMLGRPRALCWWSNTCLLSQQLADSRDLQVHEKRIESQVLGNKTFLVQFHVRGGNVMLGHHCLDIAIRLSWPTDGVRVTEQITTAAIEKCSAPDKFPFRRILASAQLHDDSNMTIIVTRNMHDRRLVLSR